MLRVMENTRRKQLAWLKAILERTSWTQTELSRQAGISHTTLSKFVNDPQNLRELDTAVVAKIVAVSPIPHYENVRGGMPAGFDDGEAEPYDAQLGDDAVVSRAIEAAQNGTNSLEPWRLTSRALENAGYLPGDILIVDSSATPRQGDVVRAQIFDQQGGTETTFRIYHKPYLVASSHQLRHLAPTIIDDRVDVRGVVVSSIRPRLSRLAS